MTDVAPSPGINLRNAMPHVITAVCLAFAWYWLSSWYSFRKSSDYLLFIAFAGSGFAVGFRFLRFPVSFSRGKPALLGSILLLFSLPWGEWTEVGVSVFREDWSRQLFVQAVFIYAVLLFFHLFPQACDSIARWTQSAVNFASTRSWLLYFPCVVLFSISTGIALFVFEQTPVVQDAAAHLFQARIFQEGRLFAPQPPAGDFFTIIGDMLVFQDNRWFSMYQPGFAAILTLPMMLGLQWFTPPLLGALTLAIWIAYVNRWHGPTAAILFGWVAMLSPFLFVMSGAMMVFTPELLALSSIIFFSRLYLERQQPLHLLVLFGSCALLLLIRAFSSLPFLLPLIFYVTWTALRRRSYALPIVMAFGLFAGMVALLYFQWKTAGDPRLSGYLLEYPDVGLGFGDHWAGRHTPIRSLENLSNNLLGLNKWLNGWYAGSLFFVLAFFFTRKKLAQWDTVLLFCAAGLCSFYIFFFFQDLFFGPRYYYPLAPICLLFVVRSVLSEDGEFTSERNRLVALLAICLISFLPLRFSSFVNRYKIEGSNAAYLRDEIAQVSNEKLLVFLDKNVQNYFINWNDPFLRAPVVIVRDLGAGNMEAMQAFPEHRPVYFRQDTVIEKMKVKTKFGLFSDPDPHPAGYTSLFEFALALDAANAYTDKDIFDISYVDVFNSRNAAERLEYLDAEEARVTKTDYRSEFRRGLLDAARIVLLPALAFETDRLNWEQSFRPADFRRLYDRSVQHFLAAGEVGKTILLQLHKVGRRIDRDNDGILTDSEIVNYVRDKVQILIVGA